MRGRGAGSNGGGPPTDLLVCFPARAHLALMPKPICSPSRSADAPKRHPSRSATRGQVASPLFRFKTRNTVRAPAVAEVISEPTSPKVTCAGQIKVSRPKTKLPTSASGVNKQSWLSVMEEMEELRHRQRRGRGHSWLQALGLKKEAVHLLHGLRGLRLRMSCFGSFRNPAAGCTDVREEDDSSAGEDEEEEEQEEEGDEEGKQGDAPHTIFSKWFMLLEESPSDQGSLKRKIKDEDQLEGEEEEEEEEEEEDREGQFGGCLVTPSSPSTWSSAPQPPPNALLLMRCRSAPSKGWPDGSGVDGAAAGGAQGDQVTTGKKLREDEKEKERVLLMSYAPDFFKVSPDIAKETWLVGSFDPLSRSRSWKR
ncbi:hypothetical protein Taro_049435 [Colocasia esculenta]|uniref:Uncharacterized protein n=1 Tax=Colocasia esculenta TaxID=4460 RepID=A0A843XAU7_COLES|nr:hypothetical protein [Colocasia esculenta]